jgi:hypothetical protein
MRDVRDMRGMRDMKFLMVFMTLMVGGFCVRLQCHAMPA